MFSMFRIINAKEPVVGWYNTGPKLRENGLNIHQLFNDYVPTPVLVIIDVQPKELGIPTKAYYAVEEVKENATQKSQKAFVHVPSEIAAHEVEEIGVEHLLREVKDTTISTLATEVTGKLAALKGFDARLREIHFGSLSSSSLCTYQGMLIGGLRLTGFGRRGWICRRISFYCTLWMGVIMDADFRQSVLPDYDVD